MAQKATLKLMSTHCAGWNSAETGLKVSRDSISNNTKVNTFLKFEEKSFEYIKDIELKLTTSHMSEDPIGTDIYVLDRPFFSSDTVSSIQNGLKGSAFQFIQGGSQTYTLLNYPEVLKYGIMLESARYPASYQVVAADLIVEYITKETCKLAAINIKPSGELLDYKLPIDLTWTIQHEGIDVPQNKVEIEWRANGGRSNKLTYHTTVGLATIPANTFPQNVTIEYRIRLTSAYGAVGGWSGWQSFKTLLDGRAKVSGITPNTTTEQYTGESIPFTVQVDKEEDKVVQQQLEIALSQDLKTWLTKSALTTSATYSLPSHSLSEGLWYWKARVKTNYGWTLYSAPISFRVIGTPSLTNIITNGELWEKPITINWRSEYQAGYEYELYYNNEKVGNGEGKAEKQFVIPAKTFKGTQSASIRVRAYNITPTGKKIYTQWVERNITLKDITATISNLIIEGDHWEKPVRLSWRSTDQEQFKIEIFKGNTLLLTYSGTTDTTYNLPEETLKAGEYTFKVWVGYAKRFVNSTERSKVLKDVEATVSNLALSGSNIDLDLTLSWTSAHQQKYELEIYKDENQVKSYSGTTHTALEIPHNSLTTGLHKFKIRVAYKDRWSQWIEINVTLVEAMPSIGVLEPDGVIMDKDYPIRIWWTSTNQTKWKITLDNAIVYEGTWQSEYIIPSGALQTGKHTLHLVVTYETPAGVQKTATKNAEFIVQGKPPIPTFTNGNHFTTSRPIFSWDTQDQQGYLLEIVQGDQIIWSTEWQNGLVTRQKVLVYLMNGTYTARIKIINQFSIESDYGQMTFTVDASEERVITLQAYKHHNEVRLEWDNVDYRFEQFYIIRNNEVIAKTTDTLYTDYTAFGACQYKIRGINGSDIHKDSNEVHLFFEVAYSCIATVNDLADMLNVSISKELFPFSGSLDIGHSVIHLSGRRLPVVIFGEHETNTYQVAFSQKDLVKFNEMYHRRQVFCYRDKREKLYLTIINPNYDIDVTGYHFKISAMQTDFKEGIAYD